MPGATEEKARPGLGKPKPTISKSAKRNPPPPPPPLPPPPPPPPPAPPPPAAPSSADYTPTKRDLPEVVLAELEAHRQYGGQLLREDGRARELRADLHGVASYNKAQLAALLRSVELLYALENFGRTEK